jgi:hypothetical protein
VVIGVSLLNDVGVFAHEITTEARSEAKYSADQSDHLSALDH